MEKNKKVDIKMIIIIVLTVALLVLCVFLGKQISTTTELESNRSNAERNVNEKISYAKSSYSCDVGATIETTITITGGKSDSKIKSFSTTNTEIATIEKSSQGDNKSKINVKIKCIKAGTVTLKAESNGGASTTASLTVNEVQDKIVFNKTNYTCKEGDRFDASVTSNSRVSSITSSNEEITMVSTISSSGNTYVAHMSCSKAGTVKLTAKTESGVSATANVTVTKSQETVKFSAASYTCKVGEVINTMVRTAKGDYSFDIGNLTYSSADSSIATIEEGNTKGLIPNCTGCYTIHMTCKKVGTTKLIAKFSDSVKDVATITVTK